MFMPIDLAIEIACERLAGGARARKRRGEERPDLATISALPGITARLILEDRP